MDLVFLGLGSNRGDSSAILGSAFAELGGLLQGARISSIYVSKARYVTDQPDFLNAVVSGWTGLGPRELLDAIHGIEATHGRDREKEIPKGPRSLDIDILLYGKRLVAEEDLIIPHAALRERKFALLPLLELAPGLEDPLSGSPFSRILASLPPQGIYLLDPSHYDRLYI